MLHSRIVSALALMSSACFCVSSGCASENTDATGTASTTTSASTTSSAGGGEGGQGGGQGGQGGTGGQGGAGGSGGAGGAGGQGGQGGGLGCIDSDAVVLAVRKLYVGDQNFDDTPNVANGWKQFGHNLDGMVTVNDFTNHCLPSAGGIPALQKDGNGGIDNSFGRNILPILNGITPSFGGDLNQSILDGNFTILLKLDQLGPGPDQAPVVTKLYTAAPLGQAPSFDGSDCWPVVREQLLDPADIESTTVFVDSSVAGDLWTSGSPIVVDVTLSIIGYPLPLHLRHAMLSTQLDPDHEGATLGQLGGVLDTEEFIETFRQVLGTFDASLCQGSTLDSIANQFRQASDILSDGTQDPLLTCNGISIGLGFKMEAVKLGGIAPPAPPVVNPCP